MEVERFAEFWARQGHHVIRTRGCCWYDPQPMVYMSLPYHRTQSPARGDLARVLLRGPALCLRYPADTGAGAVTRAGAENTAGAAGGLFVVTDRDYDFPSLHSKSRNCTRRGLENCTIERVEARFLGEHGHGLNVDTLTRQDRDPTGMPADKWKRYCEAAGAVDGFELWGAFIEGELASFAVTALVEDCYNILHQSSADRFLRLYPNNALIFTLTRSALARPEVGFVSYGLKSIEDTPGLDQFKRHLGYELRPFHERIVFNPLVSPFLALGGGKLIRWMAGRHPESDRWRKGAMILDLSRRNAPRANATPGSIDGAGVGASG